MKFLDPNPKAAMSSAVIHSGKMLETVLVAFDDDGKLPPGGAAAEMREIFKQLDETLAEVGLNKNNVCTARLYLQNVMRDVGDINPVWREYFGSHTPTRRCYGVDLQAGMMVEAAFTAEFPE